MVDFGWSAGCIVDAIKAADKIRRALQDAGGAKDHYAETIAFLSQVAVTFKYLEKHIEDNPESPYRELIEHQLKLLQTPWKKIESSYMEKYAKSLGVNSTRSKIKQAPRKMQWALKDVDDIVRKTKADILGPLQMIESFLSLELMYVLTRACAR